MMSLLDYLTILIRIMIWLIIARSLSTWFPNARKNPIVSIIYYLTDPIMSPLYKIVPRIGAIDITPITAILVLWGVTAILESVKS